jgi:hypothetical protein
MVETPVGRYVTAVSSTMNLEGAADEDIEKVRFLELNRDVS